MELDDTYAYYLVGKTTAQALTHAQAESLPGMQSVFTCTDFSGYSGPPGWALPDYYQSPESDNGLPLQCGTAYSLNGKAGPSMYDLAAIRLTTKHMTPDGNWTSGLSGANTSDLTGRFLVGIKGPSQALFTPITYGDNSSVPERVTGLSVVYSYSPDMGAGQYISVVTTLNPYFQPQVDAVLIFAAYDGGVPPEPQPNFWTSFVNAREVV